MIANLLVACNKDENHFYMKEFVLGMLICNRRISKSVLTVVLEFGIWNSSLACPLFFISRIFDIRGEKKNGLKIARWQKKKKDFF